jgi:hypothetical protein
LVESTYAEFKGIGAGIPRADFSGNLHNVQKVAFAINPKGGLELVVIFSNSFFRIYVSMELLLCFIFSSCAVYTVTTLIIMFTTNFSITKFIVKK